MSIVACAVVRFENDYKLIIVYLGIGVWFAILDATFCTAL